MYGAINEPEMIPQEYDIITSIGVSGVMAMTNESRMKSTDTILQTTPTLSPVAFFIQTGAIKSIVSVVDAVIVIDARVDTDAEMRSTSIIPRSIVGTFEITSILGMMLS